MKFLDITFIVPVRIDCKERLVNLETIIRFYRPYGIKFIIGEDDKSPRCSHLADAGVEYHSFSIDERIFYRTRILNMLLSKVDTEYVANYDCDVLFPIPQIEETMNFLHSGIEVVYPYSGVFLDVAREDISKVVRHDFNVSGPIINNNSYGGAVFFNTNVYREGGGENEQFISWSAEDEERHERFKKLGRSVCRVPGKCYHLTHPRGINSSMNNPYWAMGNEELERVRSMTIDQLKAYVSQWKK